MGKPVSTAQSHAVIATFMNTVDWGRLDAGTLQRLIKNPKEAGRMFTVAMKRPWTKHLRPFYPVFASVVLAPPEQERRIAAATDVFTQSIGPLLYSSHFLGDIPKAEEKLVDTWAVVEDGTATEILDDFDFKEISFTQSQVVDIVQYHDRLLQKSKNCIPFQVAGVPYIAIIEANARGRLSITAEHYDSKAGYDRSCYFILARKRGE